MNATFVLREVFNVAGTTVLNGKVQSGTLKAGMKATTPFGVIEILKVEQSPAGTGITVSGLSAEQAQKITDPIPFFVPDQAG